MGTDVAVTAPFAGTVIAIARAATEPVRAGAALVVLEAMKMEHEVVADADGVVRRVEVAVGDTVDEGQLLAVLAPGEAAAGRNEAGPARQADPDASRPDLDAVRERHAVGLDDARPEAVARRRERGLRTARENLAGLVDEGTYVEYGPLIFAAQERRRSREELIARTPADGLVAGVGDVDGSPTVVMSYDYTVLAGTQGMRNHLKKDRLFEIAERRRLPVVLFAEGGGGRPGDVDMPMVAGLDCRAFHLFGRLSGLVPLVGITAGYCFAGNAALLGSCDVVIATEDSSIGMGGPAMIEGGGLGSSTLVTSARSRCRTPTASSTCASPTRPGRSPRPGATSPTSAGRPSPARSPTSARCATSSLPSAGASTTSARSSTRSSTPARCSSCAAASGWGWSPRWPASRAARWAWWPTTRATSAARSTPTGRTRPRASCSCATPSTFRSSSCATRRDSWSARRPSARRRCATSGGCSSSAPT